MSSSRSWRSIAVVVGAAIAFLGLTGYTINSSNLIIWTYLGQTLPTQSPYTSAGVASHSGYTSAFPSSLPVPNFPSDLNSRIALMLPEKMDIRNNRQVALSNDDQTNIILNGTADVWVTFLNEGAGFQNSVGYFTYNPDNPPLHPSDVSTEQIFIPNASVPPLSAAGTQGATAYLGNFTIPSGQTRLGIGFFVAANGWSATGRKINNVSSPGVKENIDRNWIYYSLKGLNPEPATGNLNQHTILLKDQNLAGTDNRNYQRLVLGFEDYLRTSSSDHDFNDVIMAVHVGPGANISNLAGLPPMVTSTTDPDTDGDGVKDSVDEFPNDSTKAFSRWYPGSNSWGTLAYEDNWPSKGDYDFNDVVVRYRSREILNASRLVSGLEMNLNLLTRGGVLRSGFALNLPGIAAAQISSASLLMPDGSTTAISPVAGQSGALFEIIDNTQTLMPLALGSSDPCAQYYNTGGITCAIQPSFDYKLTVNLVSPTASFPSVPYDPFIFRTNETQDGAGNWVQGVAKGVEVHLPGRMPSARADTTFFNTVDDASNVNTGKTYVTSTGLPWAIDVPYAWDYPVEFVDIVRVYPNIVSWAASGGTSNTNWYVTPGTVSLTFRNGR
jgi:LruC domain-containing protein